MRLVIKNMVCNRCIMTVQDLLKKNNLLARHVQLGEVELHQEPSSKKLEAFAHDLTFVGFELLDDQKRGLIERIKNLLIQKVQSGEIQDHFSISKYLSDNIYKDYSSLSKLFSEVEGITIEQFFILQKIEKAKELLVYDEKNLSEIAFTLGYSSVAHLSSQFKKVTGLTPSHFKTIGHSHRKPLDHIHN